MDAGDDFDIRLEPSLDIDDAFSDSQDLDSIHQFSPDAIRDDLARNSLSWRVEDAEDDDDVESRNGSLGTTMDSFSTLNIGGDERSEEDDQSPSQFVSISLSTSRDGVSNNSEEHTELPPDSTEPEQPYPAVVIDVSSHKVTISTDNTQITTPLPSSTSLQSHSRSSSTAFSDHSEHSTKSLPSPEPSSVTPTHPNFTASTSTSILPSPSATVVAASVSETVSGPSSTSKSSSPKHRLARSVGPSALEKFVSKTRPSFLPPKSRQEDDKHMADWQAMMKQSRAAAEKRRKALQERRLAREKKIEESLHLWEKEIVPDWRVVQKDPRLRKLWWKGIPTKLRASMWERAVGNPLALSKDNFRSCSARAKRALNSGTFSAATLSKIEADIASTLPSLHIFHHENGPLYSDLKDMLCAWVVARADEGLGYTIGAAKVAAMLLINMPIQQAFVVMRNLLERHCLRSFFGGSKAKEDVEAYYRIFETLLADGMPKIYFNFKQHQVSPASYLPDWIVPLFLDHLPFEACARIWDVLLLEGDSFLYRAALGILGVLEPRLFFPDRQELLQLLNGENKAAIDVATREGRPLDGGKYEIYGLDEETLWERIDSMDEWWKESTWNRLTRRELPDL
ncbi:rab-GTPase-TBC domain-containing protein [Lentinula raphanica]|uniref:Rab-GTPase-TBC domain-containing protein n=1 Tax=Lentinula raphanica TaxID=153919 RepID=A0AA38UKP8_9AGAR|nr:rab-GTPase-TBC domain-containing protein [Lentinula raphanica]KAJ3844935.1 rab-GTPase-TBC domain-containing protein [Lentinula raphanica]KAJ3977896.1 rab-GTPase-TBC domain-containing protein [Lentinula raphanica]